MRLLLYFITLFCFLSFGQVFAQFRTQTLKNNNVTNFEQFFVAGTFVLKGKFDNPEKEFFEVYLSDLNHQQQTLVVLLKEDGSFEESFNIVGGQKIFFRDHIGYDLQVHTGDTIEMYRSSKTPTVIHFKQKGAQAFRDLEYLRNLYHDKHFGTLYQKLFAKNSVVSPQHLANVFFNDLMSNIIHSPSFVMNDARINQLIDDEYYHLTTLLTTAQERSSSVVYSDSLLVKMDNNRNDELERPRTATVKEREFKKLALSESDFMKSADYRAYLVNLLDYGSWIDLSTSAYYPTGGRLLQILYTIAGNYGSSSLVSENLIYNYIFGRYKDFQPNDVEEAFNFAFNFIKSPYLTNKLTEHKNHYVKFGRGMPAPAFEFEDRHGKSVSLSSLKGKVVYLDFWGIHCGPCLYENENHAPDLYEHYKDKDVVFVNVCFDVDRDKWEQQLKAEKPNVIELYASGKRNNNFIKTYNVFGIPHYFIIDKNGNLYNNNAPRPSSLKRNMALNELSRLLK